MKILQWNMKILPLKNDDFGATRAGATTIGAKTTMNFVSKKDGFCIKNDEFCIKKGWILY